MTQKIMDSGSVRTVSIRPRSIPTVLAARFSRAAIAAPSCHSPCALTVALNNRVRSMVKAEGLALARYRRRPAIVLSAQRPIRVLVASTNAMMAKRYSSSVPFLEAFNAFPAMRMALRSASRISAFLRTP